MLNAVGRTVTGRKVGGTTESTMIDNNKSQATIFIVPAVISLLPPASLYAAMAISSTVYPWDCILVFVTLIREIVFGLTIVRSDFA
jgi:hypothetical protein